MKKIILLCLMIVLISGCSKQIVDTNKSGDENPPWINVENYVFETEVGAPINYDTAVAYDETDGPCDVVIEGRVNFNIAGEYYLKYISHDTSGNVSEEPFTVIVYKSNHIEESTIANGEDVLKPCDKEGTIDINKPCDFMVSDLTDYQMIFQDSEGYDHCIAYGDEMTSNNLISQYHCEKLLRNDNKVWGYGIKITKP